MNNVYRNCTEEETVNRIKHILKDNKISVIENWVNDVKNSFSVQLRIEGTELCVNGKGFTYFSALASAYGELMERLQSGYMFRAFSNYRSECVVDYENMLKKYFGLLKYETIEKNELVGLFLKMYEFSTNKGCTDFSEIKNSDTLSIPNVLLDIIYGTNGLGTGNTSDEALMQCFCEIIERATLKSIMYEKPRKFDYLVECDAEIGETLFDKKYYDIFTLDLSCYSNFPVLGVLIIEKQTHRFIFKVAAHPNRKVAFKMVVSELLQGRNVNYLFFQSGSSVMDNESEIDYYSAFSYGISKMPCWLLNCRTKKNSNSNVWGVYEKCKSIEECNKHFISRFNELGYKIYKSEKNKFGIPTVQLIVPNYSEVTIMDYSSLVLQYDLERSKRMIAEKNFTRGNVEFIVHCFEKLKFRDDESLAEVINLPIRNDDNEYFSLNCNLFVGMLLLYLKKYEHALVYLTDFYHFLELNCDDVEILNYYRFVLEVVSLKSRRYSFNEIEETLNEFYNSESIIELTKSIEGEAIFEHVPFVNCMKKDYNIEYCSSCQFSNSCFKEEIERIRSCVE